MRVDKKGIIYFISGLVIGAGASGYLTYRYVSKFKDQEKATEFGAIADYYHKKYDTSKAADENKKEEEVKKDEEIIKAESDAKIRADEISEKEYQDISGIYKPDESDRVVTDYRSVSNPSSNGSGSRKRSKKKKPYLISEEDFETNDLGYEKNFVTYYEADNVYVDEELESPVDDLVDILGQYNVDKADEYGDQLYITNDQLKAMYMVTVEHRAWTENGL